MFIFLEFCWSVIIICLALTAVLMSAGLVCAVVFIIAKELLKAIKKK